MKLLVAAWWVSYFVAHWLFILEMLDDVSVPVYFLVGAGMLTLCTAANVQSKKPYTMEIPK